MCFGLENFAFFNLSFEISTTPPDVKILFPKMSSFQLLLDEEFIQLNEEGICSETLIYTFITLY